MMWTTIIMCHLYINLNIKPSQSITNKLLTLHWSHNDHGGVSNYQSQGCLLNCLFRRRSKKTSKLRVTGLCAGNSQGPVNSPHKAPVTWKMVPFDEVIMKFHSISREVCINLRFDLFKSAVSKKVSGIYIYTFVKGWFRDTEAIIW